MAANLTVLSTLTFFFFWFFFFTTTSKSFIGINYGEVADNLPSTDQTVNLLKSLPAISKLRLYGADPLMLKALAGSGISVIIGAANGDIPALASDPTHASQWVDSNVSPFYPATDIILVTVGNEVMSSGDTNLITQLLPAMQNIQTVLTTKGFGKIKVSTVHSMAVMGVSEPPSSGAFNPTIADAMKSMLEFQRQNGGSPLTINPYPYFAYESDPRPETLAFCLFQANAGRVDGNTNIKYMNMFDAQVDAVYSALNSIGYKDIDIVVAETGWPYSGDSNEPGPSVENAKAYNGGLISHLRSGIGTPLMPGKTVDTYIFALYDEDLKPGATSERFFGLFKPDQTMTYDIGLSTTTTTNNTQAPSSTPPPPPSSSRPSSGGGWCVPKQGVTDAQLQNNLDYACSQQNIDCGPIQPGGSCFDPNTVASHAAFAMNQYYQKSNKQSIDCDFSQTALLSSVNPSYNACVYPGGGGDGVSVISRTSASKKEDANSNDANYGRLIRRTGWWWSWTVVIMCFCLLCSLYDATMC